MNGTSMYSLFTSTGKVNIFAWILFALMLTAFIFTIYTNWFTLRKMVREETRQLFKMAELELNLRELRKDEYKESTY